MEKPRLGVVDFLKHVILSTIFIVKVVSILISLLLYSFLHNYGHISFVFRENFFWKIQRAQYNWILVKLYPSLLFS